MVDQSATIFTRYECPFSVLKICKETCKRFYTKEDMLLHANSVATGEMAMNLVNELIDYKLLEDPFMLDQGPRMKKARKSKPQQFPRSIS